MELNLLVAEHQVLLVALLDCRPRDHGVQHRINALTHVLDQHGLTCVDGALQHSQHVLLAQTNDLQVARFLLLTHPRDALQLRVNHQGPPRRVRYDARVLDGHTVSRQAL